MQQRWGRRITSSKAAARQDLVINKIQIISNVNSRCPGEQDDTLGNFSLTTTVLFWVTHSFHKLRKTFTQRPSLKTYNSKQDKFLCVFGGVVCLSVCLFLLPFKDRISLWSPHWPGTCYVHQVDLKSTDPLASVFQVRGFKVCTTMPD